MPTSMSIAPAPLDLPPLPYAPLPTPSIEPATTPVKKKIDRLDNVFRGGFGPDAAPKELPFPADANITAYELLTFLPNCLMSADTVYRLISNGGTRQTIWTMVNVARDMPQGFDPNRCGTVMYRAMTEAGFEKWTIKTHDQWHHSRLLDGWDETVLNVRGYRTPSAIRLKPVEQGDILFRSLAAGVRRMPQGDDALDLTRMVEYSVNNPSEAWLYPRDYEVLCNHIGGALQPTKEHIDRAAFKRWEGQTAPPHRIWSKEEKEAAIKAMESKLKKNQEGARRRGTPASTKRARRETPASTERARQGTPAPEENMRDETPMSEQQSREDTPTAEKRPRRVTPASTRRSRQATPTPNLEQKTRGRPRKRTRLEEIEFDDIERGHDEEVAHQEYVRAPAEYVAPPGDTKAPSTSAIRLAFAAEHDAHETDPSSAYAFGGPRHRPPYRMLHDIQQPHASDISGWAENLRWAWEQRACFWHAVETEGWNESPAHMELIAQARQEQIWASDELLEMLPDEEGDEDPEHEGFV